MANEKRLIDANALLSELEKFENPMPNKSGYDFLCGVATAITEIENAPIVDAVEVVHGQWIRDGDVVVCSNCGEEHAWEEYRPTFCEGCGAKMDGERKENGENQ